MKDVAPALVLASTITASIVEATPAHRRQGAPVRLIVENTFEPLDLSVGTFRYLVPCRRTDHYRR